MSFGFGQSTSSSLQRTEATNVKLERMFTEIRDLIEKLSNSSQTGSGTSSEQPTLSALDTKTSKIAILQLNAALMKTAEVGQRKWSSIGVDEWIQAGRWWLMKVCIPRVESVYHAGAKKFARQAQMTLAEEAAGFVSHQGYLDLIKAAWILIDVIARHPSLNLLDSGVRCEVELLGQVSSRESLIWEH